MVRYLLLSSILAVTTLCVTPATSTGQQSVSTSGRERGATLGFSFAWTGGISMGPDGVAQVRNYPVVRRLTAHSPAARAGVLPGDQIVSANGRDGRRPPLFEDVTPGSRVVLRIRRGGEEREIAFVAGTAPTR